MSTPDRWPDFFILGAPKCGTTSLYSALVAHHRVFMPNEKEPHFFSTDFPAHRKFTSPEDYLALFADARPDQIRGEASVWYLYSQEAVPNILARNPKAKFIVILRRQTEMLPSLWEQLKFVFKEDTDSFEQAWGLRAERAAGRRIPANSNVTGQTAYDTVASFGEQCARLSRLAAPEQILVLLFEDLVGQTDATLEKVAAFLGLDEPPPLYLPHSNPRKEHRIPRLSGFLMRPGGVLATVKSTLQRMFPATTKQLGRTVYAYLSREQAKRGTLTGPLRDEILAAYETDIELLEKVLSRDLREWKT